MMGREKREMGPVLLKFGAVFALSFGGILYSILRTKRIRSSQSHKSSKISSDGENNFDCTKDDDHEHQATASSSLASQKIEGSFLPNKSLTESLHPNDHVQEIKSLKSEVENLKERERNLEKQLLSFNGLKEQETTIMELQNRLKVSNVEAKLFNLKIESLQVENRRLEGQVCNYEKLVSELESARAKIKVLKRKLRYDVEQKKEEILILKERVEKLQEQEQKGVFVSCNDCDNIRLRIEKVKELEEEIEELRRLNRLLKAENLNMGERLEYAQIIANSVLEDEEKEMLRNETRDLRHENEYLTNEIELLRASQCSEVEELIYLRWINACLRHELRNNQPNSNNKTMAKDLSTTLSPNSEEKTKQLILKYANITDFDFDNSSLSPASCLTNTNDFDDLSENKTKNSSKGRIFGKVMRLLRGKESFGHSFDLCRSLDLRKSSLKKEDRRRSLEICRKNEGKIRNVVHKYQGNRTCEDIERSELVKYAEVLKGSKSRRLLRRATSFSSF